MNKIFGAVARYVRQMDALVVLLSLALPVFGAVMVYSATMRGGTVNNFRTVLAQIIAIVFGFVCMIVLSRIDYHTVIKLWKVIAAAALFLLVITLVLGKAGNGQTEQKNWLALPGLGTIQPSELVKIAFIVTFTKHLDTVKDDVSSLKNVVLLGIHALIPVALVALEGDLGMTCVFLFTFVCMMFAANLKLRYFVGAGILLLASAPFAWKMASKKIKDRVLLLFNPQSKEYALTAAMQQNQGVKAIGSGELWGYGLFHGPITQSPYDTSLTSRQNDMIFSVIGEELGFVGCVLVIAALLILIIRILMIAGNSKDLQGSLLCIGVFSTFAFQTVNHIGMNLLITPVIGLTLPFISQGGTSVLSCYLGIGLVLSVYMHRKDLLFTGQAEE